MTTVPTLNSALRLGCLVCLWNTTALGAGEPIPLDIGSRRELLVDDFLLDRREGVELRLHAPTPREVVLVCDAPWEGSGCGYETVFRDGDRIRMYYVAADLTSADGTKMASRPIFACYAESQDAIHWVKPELGLFEFGGSKRNNIVWSGSKLDNFTPFKDPNP
jgi:hypothetical protein